MEPGSSWRDGQQRGAVSGSAQKIHREGMSPEWAARFLPKEDCWHDCTAMKFLKESVCKEKKLFSSYFPVQGQAGS